MTVSELIRLLLECDRDATVSVWDAYDDDESVEVRVSRLGDNIHIGNTNFGKL